MTDIKTGKLDNQQQVTISYAQLNNLTEALDYITQQIITSNGTMQVFMNCDADFTLAIAEDIAEITDQLKSLSCDVDINTIVVES